MAKGRIYSDAEKLAYWRAKAKAGAGNRSGWKQSNAGVQYKKSGASFSKITKGANEGLYFVSAWKKTRAGMVKATATPLSNKSTESARGNQYIPYLVTCIHMGTLQATKYNGIMNIQTRVLVISDLGMCITPNGSGKTKSGTMAKGYFGKFTK
ncbi:hypothetical protein AAH994_06080 [Weeksellaceae bacterium A-14]